MTLNRYIAQIICNRELRSAQRAAQARLEALRGFPTGARVLVDGRDEVVIAQHFPRGSTSFLFPHYKVHFIGGDRNVAVSKTRIGVERTSDPRHEDLHDDSPQDEADV